jgi:hypothetical protein
MNVIFVKIETFCSNIKTISQGQLHSSQILYHILARTSCNAQLPYFKISWKKNGISKDWNLSSIFLEFTNGKQLNYCFLAGIFPVIWDHGHSFKIACSYFQTRKHFNFWNIENSANNEHLHASNSIVHLFLIRIIYVLKLKNRRHPDCASWWHMTFTRLSVIVPCVTI